MSKEELKKILENHLHWINEDCDGWETMKAILREADLYGANLRGANLYGAVLREADLYGANLREADLYGADLYGADLRGANLCEADLYGANLCGANLCEADLYGANLCGANLRKANLYGADLYGANLCGANLRKAINIPFIPMSCPDTGSFIGWKKDGTKNLIIKLLIPEDARRTSATGRKCRCDKAHVLAIENLDGTQSGETETFADYDHSFCYRVGEIVTPKEPFGQDRWDECSSGIHFFINRQEAIDY